MFDSNSNYPPGLSDRTPGAPWNDCDPDEEEVDCLYSVVVTRNTTITTTDYRKEPWEDYDFDGVEWSHHGGVDYDFSDTDFLGEYTKQHFSPVQLIGKLEELLTTLLNGEEIKLKKHEIKDLLEECRGWSEQDDECEQDK